MAEASKKKIFLIEDDEITRKNLEAFLAEAGFGVESESQGDAGLRKLRRPEAKYDLLLLDIWLPKVNGFEILEALNRNNSKLPVIVISNSGQPIELKKALEMGAKDYLVKVNFTPQEVLEKIQKFFNDNSAK